VEWIGLVLDRPGEAFGPSGADSTAVAIVNASTHGASVMNTRLPASRPARILRDFRRFQNYDTSDRPRDFPPVGWAPVAPRIAVIGSCCSGKTTFAAELAEILGVAHVELDALHHGPNWREASAEELQARVDEALASLNGWVTDGNYMHKLGTRVIDEADMVVWLDLPLRTLLPRIYRRSRRRMRERVELWHPGNFETWRGIWVLSSYTIRTHHRRRRYWPSRFQGKTVVRLRSSAEADAWLAGN
jgi:adenylate kinase family enzyme